MSVFHTLLAGNTGHPAMLGPGFDGTAFGTVVGLVVAMGTVEATDPGVETRIDGRGSDLSVVDVVEGALVDGVDVSGGLDRTVLPGAEAGAPGSVWPDSERWRALHEAVSEMTMTPATSVALRFDRFGIADLAQLLRSYLSVEAPLPFRTYGARPEGPLGQSAGSSKSGLLLRHGPE
jgi:hypothetical protein